VSFGDGVPKISLASPNGAAIAALPVACDGRTRSEADDIRISTHEAAHCVAARLLGVPLGGVSCDPDPSGKFSGLTWGLKFFEHYGDDADDAEACERLASLMPKAGESRDGDVADIHMQAVNRVIEIAAGSLGEAMLLEGLAWSAPHDRAQETAFARLLCSTPQAAEAFVQFCTAQARDLLTPYLAIVTELANVLRARRTLSGAEVDQVIAAALASASVEQEHRRRADWRRRCESAATFRAIHRVGGIEHGDYGDYDAHR
jgi:hypothetical protein